MDVIVKYYDLVFGLYISNKLDKYNRITFLEVLDVDDDIIFKTKYKKIYPNASMKIYGSTGKTAISRRVRIQIETIYGNMIRDSKLRNLINGFEKE